MVNYEQIHLPYLLIVNREQVLQVWDIKSFKQFSIRSVLEHPKFRRSTVVINNYYYCICASASRRLGDPIVLFIS